MTRSPRRILSGENSILVGRRRSPPPPVTSQSLANQLAPFSDHEPSSGAVGAVQTSKSGLDTSAQPSPTRPIGPSSLSVTHTNPPHMATTHSLRISPGHDQNIPIASPTSYTAISNHISQALSFRGKFLSIGHLRFECKNQFRCCRCYR